MHKCKVGILTFSDGRKSIHEDLLKMNMHFQDRLKQRLESTEQIEAVAGDVIWTSELAKQEALKLMKADVEVTIFNFAVWSFPHLAVIASQFAPGPFLLLSNVNPKYPGLVGMLASAGALEQIGIFPARAWGDIEDDKVLSKALAFLRAATAVKRLRGETYGLFGGHPMGMYTAAANLDQWQKIFGINVEHIDQWEIVRRVEQVPAEKVEKAFHWIERHVRKIHYDGQQLTPEKIKLQIRSYYVVRELIKEKNLNFVGIKAQPELTDHFVTTDITEAFLNDPYDWDGEHEPIVAATEADMDGALTMEILKHLCGEPVLFADVRHYDAESNFFDLCNSGSHPTYFAGRSHNPLENLKKVEFYPEGFYFPAGGASVRHIAAPGEVTIARLARRNGRYWLAIAPAEFLDLGGQTEEKAAATQIEWPHAFARLRGPADKFLAEYDSNHCNAIYGNWVEELIWVAKILGIDYKVFQ